MTVCTTGYTINDDYYAVQHFAKGIGTGWTRVAPARRETVITASAFLSPDGTQLTLVLINTDGADHQVTIDPGTFAGRPPTSTGRSGTTERFAARRPARRRGLASTCPRVDRHGDAGTLSGPQPA